MSSETLLNQMTERFRSLSLELNGLRSDNDALISHVNQLRKVISDGNGQPSLVERTAILNTRINQLEEQLKLLEQQKSEEIKGNRTFWIALLGGLMGIVSTIVQFFFSK